MKPFQKIPQILIILLILAQAAFAQEQDQEQKTAGTKLGIRGGVQVTAMGPLDWSFGWHAGAVSDVVKLTNFELLRSLYSIYVQPGLYFSTRESVWKKNTYWLEVPVLLSFKRQPKSSSGLFSNAYRFEMGPYVNIGVLGDYKDVVATSVGDQEDQMSRFDVGITFTAGSEIGMFWIYSSYSRGFIDVSDYYDSGTFCWKIIGIGMNF
jgi:hypothetical protein